MINLKTLGLTARDRSYRRETESSSMQFSIKKGHNEDAEMKKKKNKIFIVNISINNNG